MVPRLALHPEQANGVGQDQQDGYSLDVVKPVAPVILSHLVVVVAYSDLQPLLELQVRDEQFPFADLVVP